MKLVDVFFLYVFFFNHVSFVSLYILPVYTSVFFLFVSFEIGKYCLNSSFVSLNLFGFFFQLIDQYFYFYFV